MNKIRIGIVGGGYMASVHAKNLATIENVEIAAICDPFVKPENLIEAFGIKMYFDNFKKMIDEANVTAIVLTIPPFAHNGEVEYAAEKGVHVFMEKPVALTVDRAKSMADVIKRTGVTSMVGYMMRYGAAVSKLKEMIDSGKAGKVTLFDARYECNSLHTPWWKDKLKSGGQILEQIIHLYDLATHFAGAPKSVVGLTANLCHTDVEGYTVEDTSSSLIQFKNGAIGSICGTNCAVPMKWNGLFTVVCEKVTVFFDDPNNAIFVYTDGEEPIEEKVSGNVDTYLEEMKAFISVLSGQQLDISTIQDGLESLTLVANVTKSNGQSINM